jgi:hypothetical protein
MMEKKFKYSLILRATDDKRLQYITARRLGELWPDQSFAQWKARVERGETIILLRTDSMAEITPFKEKLDEAGALTDIVEQKSIGGAKVF